MGAVIPLAEIPQKVHPSGLPDAPESIEPQFLFLRAAAYFQYAIFLVEERILELEDIRKRISGEGAAELRLCYIQNGHYGEVEIGNPDRPLAYRGVLADNVFREQIGRPPREEEYSRPRALPSPL